MKAFEKVDKGIYEVIYKAIENRLLIFEIIGWTVFLLAHILLFFYIKDKCERVGQRSQLNQILNAVRSRARKFNTEDAKEDVETCAICMEDFQLDSEKMIA